MKFKKCSKCFELKNIESFRKQPHKYNSEYRRVECNSCKDKNRVVQRKKQLEKDPSAVLNLKKYERSDKRRYSRYHQDCKRRTRLKRGILMELTLEQFVDVSHKPCVFCGLKDASGIDRINSDGNYTVDNTQPCCKTCNQMKSNLKETEFIEHIKKILMNRGI